MLTSAFKCAIAEKNAKAGGEFDNILFRKKTFEFYNFSVYLWKF